MNRLPIARVVCIAAVLVGASCSSDDKSSDSTTPGRGTSASTVTTAASSAVTASTATTVTTVATPVTAETGTTVTTTATTTGSREVTSPSDSVRLGDTGPGVEQIQTALKAAGYDIESDGVFGPVTDRAVRDFQQKNDLAVDGVVGPKTWAKLGGSPADTTSTTTG